MRCKVKYQEKNKTKWYAGEIQTIGHSSIQVKFMYDGSVVELDQDVLCNNRRFKYFDLEFRCHAIPHMADVPWEPPVEDTKVTTNVSNGPHSALNYAC